MNNELWRFSGRAHALDSCPEEWCNFRMHSLACQMDWRYRIGRDIGDTSRLAKKGQRKPVMCAGDEVIVNVETQFRWEI
jgi:hypothetical protein